MSCFAKKGRGLLCRTWKRDRIFRHRLRKQLLHVVAKFAELVDRRLVLRFRLTPGRAAPLLIEERGSRVCATNRTACAAPAGGRAWRLGSSLAGPRARSCRPLRAYGEVRAHIAPGELLAATPAAFHPRSRRPSTLDLQGLPSSVPLVGGRRPLRASCKVRASTYCEERASGPGKFGVAGVAGLLGATSQCGSDIGRASGSFATSGTRSKP
jgi:hypothetical protein